MHGPRVFSALAAGGHEEAAQLVRPYPEPGGLVQVSVDGGIQPRWSPDGAELFYLDTQGDTLFSASITL